MQIWSIAFIKSCDALNFEFSIKILSSNVSDILINTLNIVVLADILLAVNTDILLTVDNFFNGIKLFGDEFSSTRGWYNWDIIQVLQIYNNLWRVDL